MKSAWHNYAIYLFAKVRLAKERNQSSKLKAREQRNAPSKKKRIFLRIGLLYAIDYRIADY
jgi:hypothetical protein